ncbi:MAG TPA: polyprenol phosphomannose-dependent alpha 1,6 mannosyltransferase MptB [Frankiaceae bacterium]|nr:polyprenol phosphomannose-dependent alpha 1,6 mannosyltransferase MptB [Frankiaceae bacterium]
MISWGRLGPEPGSRNPTSWLGMLAVVAPNNARTADYLLLLVPALFLLTLLWWVLLRLAAAQQLRAKAAALIAGSWALPFVIGPVIGSRDAYAYVAQGELARRGLDPASAVVSRLGPGALLSAVDPRWRETRPPYGGVAVAIQKVAASAGRPVLSLLILRVVALIAVIALVVVAARMAAPRTRPVVVLAIAANPLVLVHLVAGAHLDAVAAALLIGGLALAQSAGGRSVSRRWLAIALCTLGAMVKLPVALGAVYLSLCALLAAGPTIAARLRSVAADVSAVAFAVGLSMMLSGGGLGWLHNFGTPGRLRTGIAPPDIVTNLIRGLGWLVGTHPSDSGLLTATRGIAAGAGIVLALVLLRPRRGAGQVGWQPPTRDRLGLALLALGLLGPVLYGWYLAPALPLLALAAARPPSARGLKVGEISPAVASWTIVLLSAVLTFATIPSLGPIWSTLGAHPLAIVAASIGTALLAAGAVIVLTKAAARLRAARPASAITG